MNTPTIKSISERMFDGQRAERELERQLDEAGVEFEYLSFDDYDNSLEIRETPPEVRLSEVAQKIVFEAGFSIAFVNHTDKWETHYRFDHRQGFAPVKGWRVSYPHKRGPEEKGIWVESVPEKWPKEWVETGGVIVKEPST